MKKTIKVLLIMGLVMLLAGVGVSTAAVMMGARLNGSYFNPFIYRWMERHEARELEWDMAEDLLEEGMAGRITTEKVKAVRKDEELKRSGDYQDFTGIQELEIQVTGGSMILLGNADLKDEIRLYWTDKDGKRGEAYRDEEDATLEIKYNRRLNFGDKDSDSVLLIEVPEDYQLRKVELDMGAGEAVVTGIKTGSLEVDVEAGSVAISQVTAGRMGLDASAGAIAYEGAAVGSIDVSCKTGVVGLLLDGKQTDYNYELECELGGIQIGDSEWGGMAKDLISNNGADKYMELECGTGGIQVSFR